MMSVLIDAKDVCDAEEKIINVSADDIERLVVKWLSEILFLFDSEGFITSSVRIQSINANSISASLKGERINLAKHHFKVDIKAITYHQLRVTVTPQDTEIVVFFDI